MKNYKKRLAILIISIPLIALNLRTLHAGWGEKSTIKHIYENEKSFLGFTITGDYKFSIIACTGIDIYCGIDEPIIIIFDDIFNLK